MPTRALALEHAQPTIASAAMPEAVRSFSALKLEDAGVGKPRPSSDCWREPVRPARLPPYEAPFKPRGSTAGVARSGKDRWAATDRIPASPL